MTRPDGPSEVVRRNNAIAKAGVTRIALADLTAEQRAAMASYLPSKSILTTTTHDLVRALRERPPPSVLKWGRNHIGVGLLTALRNNQVLEFSDGAETRNAELKGRKHLVVCETGEPLSEVIAANYAFALDADLLTIPGVEKDVAEALTEELYSLYELRGQSATDSLAQLAKRVRELCPGVVLPEGGGITFFTSHIPYGLGFPEVPSTHLEIYPDLGVSVLNGLAAGNADTTGVRSAVLVDPSQTQAPEVEVVARSLAKRRVFVRGYPWKTANVRDITNTVELFPYDFLLFATHCGDADGYRFTYEFKDASGRTRRLVVDTAIGVSQTDDPDMLNVMQFQRFHELDGVSWRDPKKSEKIEVGTAIKDFIELQCSKDLEPVARENIPRVLGSAALKMADDNYIAMPRELAASGSPVIFNNACASWHQLSGRFMFAGSRAYIGTLFPVTGAEAAQVAEFFVEHDEDMPLAETLWRAQNKTYGQSRVRRPYVMTGVYPQNLHVFQDDVPSYIRGRLESALTSWNEHTSQSDSEEAKVAEIRRYYRSEIEWFKRKWGNDITKKPTRRAKQKRLPFRP
ncbi:hypothetical protein [Roseibium aggregatum]|uniref:hypothetical protein n=1 Tax=Roseibium aggregatum TaxID=187304 RepID=UPI0025AC3BEF|nr:hypothetical protein [Roseibium aggregatum]WJS04203.1 hypothetical protein QUB73_08000 [Roseibium aggregatum]